MEAQKCSKATDGKGYDFPAQRAALVFVGVLLMTARAGAGEPAGGDPNNVAVASARQAGRREGSAHKRAAEVLLGRREDNSSQWDDVRRVTGRSGRTGMKVAQQDAETIVGHCQKALALGVKDAEVYWMMGEGYFLQKQYREASDAGLEALQIEPDFYPALHLLIRSHSRAGEYETALDYCLLARPTRREISTPHLFYFYSLCRRLMAAGRYATALSYCEKWAEWPSQTDSHWPQCNIAKEKSHLKYYLKSPIKGYPPTLALPGSPRFGRFAELSAEEKQKLMAPLHDIAVSCSSPNVTVTAVSIEKKGMLSRAKMIREWGGALHGDIGTFEIEFKGKWKEWVDRSGALEPVDLRDEINRTKAEAVKAFLQQAAPHLGIPEYVLKDLYFFENGDELAYHRELTYKGVPLRIYDMGGPGFAAGWDGRDGGPRDIPGLGGHTVVTAPYGMGGLGFAGGWYGRDAGERNIFGICSHTLYTLPADTPVEPLVTEQQAREIAAEALEKAAHSGVRQEGSMRPDDNPAGREIRIGGGSLCIQPELLSFSDGMDDTIDTDLFDPVCQFAEYRLLWFLWVAYGEGPPVQVKVDAITGEPLEIKVLWISGPTDGGRGGALAALGCPGQGFWGQSLISD